MNTKKFQLFLTIIFLSTIITIFCETTDDKADPIIYPQTESSTSSYVSTGSSVLTKNSATTIESSTTSSSQTTSAYTSTTNSSSTVHYNYSVLFIGNSYTFFNNLADIFSGLAQAGGHTVTVDVSANGGWTLEQHNADSTTNSKISSGNFDFVVLQEQSVCPAVVDCRQNNFYPSARALNTKILLSGAETIFFMTWGRKNGLDGSPDYNFPDFNSMQTELTYAYETIANELSAKISPVGISWKNAMTQDSSIELYTSDGSHPSPEGSYLAACTFYSAIFKSSSVGLSFTNGLTTSKATFYQTIASDTVLNDMNRWNLN